MARDTVPCVSRSNRFRRPPVTDGQTDGPGRTHNYNLILYDDDDDVDDSTRMMIQGVPNINFLSNTVSTKNVGILVLLLANILV